MPPFGGYQGTSQRDPGEDPEFAGGPNYPVWPGNTLGSPRLSRRISLIFTKWKAKDEWTEQKATKYYNPDYFSNKNFRNGIYILPPAIFFLIESDW